MLADKNAGAFSLEVLAMETYGEPPPVPTITESQREEIAKAIALGVPLYNEGQIQACAMVYRDVLERIKAEQPKTTWFDNILNNAPDVEPAWWYRHGMDMLLQVQSL